MSTFRGWLDEIPGISVDKFTDENLKRSSVFFLSHGHCDHMHGLDSNFFCSLSERKLFLYCTPYTKKIMSYRTQNSSLYSTIKTIDVGSPQLISFNDEQGQEKCLSVTCISAGHCPGSVMFLFEFNDQRILYTGDFRIDVNDIPKLIPLHDCINGLFVPKKIDVIYLDTTFFDSKCKYFPSRAESIQKICDYSQDWLNYDEKNVVLLEMPARYGLEYLFMEISRKLKTQIYMKHCVYDNYSVVPELNKCITGDSRNTRVHACLKYYSNPVSSIENKNILTVKVTAYRWKDRDFVDKITEFEAASNILYVCYSAHASHDELVKFVTYLKPKKLFPCVCPNENDFDNYCNRVNEILVLNNVSSDCCYNLNSIRNKFKVKCNSKKFDMSDDEN